MNITIKKAVEVPENFKESWGGEFGCPVLCDGILIGFVDEMPQNNEIEMDIINETFRPYPEWTRTSKLLMACARKKSADEFVTQLAQPLGEQVGLNISAITANSPHLYMRKEIESHVWDEIEQEA